MADELHDRLAAFVAWWLHGLPWVDAVSLLAGAGAGYACMRLVLYPALASLQAFVLVTGLVWAVGYAQVMRNAALAEPAWTLGEYDV